MMSSTTISQTRATPVGLAVTRPSHMLRATRSVGAAGALFRPSSSPLLPFVGAHRQSSQRVYGPKGRSAGPVRVQAFRNNGGGNSNGIADRVIAALPYLLPLFDGLRYGKFLFMQYPIFATIMAPFDPLIRVYFSVPFAGLVAFFAVYLGIINNQSLSRFVRFNAMQAVLLDIVLILPGLIESVLRLQPMGGTGLTIYMNAYNAIFLFIFVCVVYGIASCMAGQQARLPFVADAADAQIR